jgi:alpha-tubulin suppressor-like RCC1 family protein
VKTDGTLWVWGLNTSGRLGDGTTTDRSSPVTTVGGCASWCAVSSGFVHTMAISAC